MLGNLSLDESSLASDGSNLTDLALETLSIHLTAMEPFRPLLLLPGSALFVLLEKKILPQVTALVAEFYSAHPQEGPLLLFSNVDQWVGVYIEYKFQTPVGTHLPGLANYLARNIMDPAVQKSSIMANGEKAELVLCEVWLQILDQLFTEALKDKTSPKSRKLRGQLTRWLTAILRPLRPFGQVVLKFQPAPARAVLQGCVLQGLRALWEAEGLSVKMVIPDLGQPDTSISCYAVALIILGLLFIALILVLVWKRKTCFGVSSQTRYPEDQHPPWVSPLFLQLLTQGPEQAKD
ncbi:hypothetical protein MJG53_012794 [Ovis ammon polii x Ovis aries]|uniref:Taste receptor cell protein 1-like n=2 Tax=Ovis TaxID=9935 RepID=A0A835ZP25_SHEEP|nr:hypothetical protein JEQ12_007857 [Ovis aries]KAI4572956.1 hypothetical protein MJG53_012794 [Ovis ammon polii x Ovis aries]